MTQQPVPAPGRGQGAVIASPPIGKLYAVLTAVLLALCAALLLVGGIVAWKVLPWQRAIERIW